MHKLIGIAFVMFSTVFLSFSKTNDCSRRIRYLKCMQSCVVQLENEIRYTQTSLKEAFLHLSECTDITVSGIFRDAYKLVCNSDGKSINRSWNDVIFKRKEFLNKQDIPLLLSLGECLCNTDIEGQLKSIELFLHNLKNSVSCAEEAFRKNKNLYRGLGIYSGAIISVLFL